jgi:hypothetical protein
MQMSIWSWHFPLKILKILSCQVKTLALHLQSLPRHTLAGARTRTFIPSAGTMTTLPSHLCKVGWHRVARWYIFIPKIPFWVKFGGSCNGRCWYILRPFGKFYGQLVNSTAIRFILWSFGIFLPALVCCTKKNLATPGWHTKIKIV